MTKAAKHTPEPCCADPDYYETKCQRCHYRRRLTPEEIAAPQMREALEALIGCMDCNVEGCDDCEPIRELARAALAAAEGE